MAHGLSNFGKEEIMDTYFKGDETPPTAFEVAIYLDATGSGGDDLVDADTTESAITTEPSGAAYARQSVSLNATDMSGAMSGDYYVITLKDVTFDVSDSTVSVDSFALVDGTNIFARGELDGERDLSQENGSITYEEIGIRLN